MVAALSREVDFFLSDHKLTVVSMMYEVGGKAGDDHLDLHISDRIISELVKLLVGFVVEAGL
jgi:hypothetical protein